MLYSSCCQGKVGSTRKYSWYKWTTPVRCCTCPLYMLYKWMNLGIQNSDEVGIFKAIESLKRTKEFIVVSLWIQSKLTRVFRECSWCTFFTYGLSYYILVLPSNTEFAFNSSHFTVSANRTVFARSWKYNDTNIIIHMHGGVSILGIQSETCIICELKPVTYLNPCSQQRSLENKQHRRAYRR